MQGGLQTITNTTTSRTQTVVPAQGQPATAAVKTEPTESKQEVRVAKTPSPKKAIAPGKENVPSTTPQTVD